MQLFCGDAGHGHVQSSKKLKLPEADVPIWVNEATWGPLASALFLETGVHFAVYLVLCFSSFLCFSWVILLFKIASDHCPEVLSSVAVCAKVVMCFADKVHVLDKRCSDISYSAIGHEFGVNEVTTYIKLEA